MSTRRLLPKKMFEFSQVTKKEGGSNFSHKKGGVGKLGGGGGLFKRGGVSLIFIATNPFQCYLSLNLDLLNLLN